MSVPLDGVANRPYRRSHALGLGTDPPVDRLAAALLVGTAPESPDGVAVVLAGVGLVALRGYLVPGTPALTDRYLPERVRLALGADHPRDERSPDPSEFETLQRVAYEREHAVDPDTFLTETGVCQASETAGENAAPSTVDPTLTPAFAAAQDEEIETLRESGVTEAAVARAFDEDADAVAAVAADQPSYEVGNRVRTWTSRAALVHDVATDRALREWTDRWAAVPARVAPRHPAPGPRAVSGLWGRSGTLRRPGSLVLWLLPGPRNGVCGLWRPSPRGGPDGGHGETQVALR